MFLVPHTCQRGVTRMRDDAFHGLRPERLFANGERASRNAVNALYLEAARARKEESDLRLILDAKIEELNQARELLRAGRDMAARDLLESNAAQPEEK
jgi:hypothetical protein